MVATTLVIFRSSAFAPHPIIRLPLSHTHTPFLHPHLPLPAHAPLPRHMTTSPLFTGRRF